VGRGMASDPHAPHFGTMGGFKSFKRSGSNLEFIYLKIVINMTSNFGYTAIFAGNTS